MSGYDNDKAAFEARGELRDIRKRRLNTAIAEALGHPERSQMPPEPPTGYKLTHEEQAEIAKLRVDLARIRADASKGDAEKHIDLQKTIFTAAASVLSSYETASGGIAREKVGGEVDIFKQKLAELDAAETKDLGSGVAQPSQEDVTAWINATMIEKVTPTMLADLESKMATLLPKDKISYLDGLNDALMASGQNKQIRERLAESGNPVAGLISRQLAGAEAEIETVAAGLTREYAGLREGFEQAVSKIGVTGAGPLLQSLLSVGSEEAESKEKKAPEEDTLDIWLKTMADEKYDDHPVIIRDREDFYKDPRFQKFMEKYGFKDEGKGINAPRQALTYLNQLVREQKAKSKKAGLKIIEERNKEPQATPEPAPAAAVADPGSTDEQGLPTVDEILAAREGWTLGPVDGKPYFIKGGQRVLIPPDAFDKVAEAVAGGAFTVLEEEPEPEVPTAEPEPAPTDRRAERRERRAKPEAAAPTAPPAGRPTAAAAKPKGVPPVKKEPESKETQEAPPDELRPPEQASVASLSGVGEGVQSRPAELLTAVGPSSQKKRMEALKRRLQPSTIA